MRNRLNAGLVAVGLVFWTGQAMASEGSPQDILRQALLGAGSGAISAELSGGKAGKGALIGAGTNVIGGALLSFFFDSPSRTSYAPATSYYSAPAQTQQVYYQTQPVYYQPAQQEVVYTQPSYSYGYTPRTSGTDSNRRILRQGLLGAGVGAISAEASGGKAGTGALVGAGTNVIGGALLDTLFTPSASSNPRYYSTPVNYSQSQGLHKKIVRHFDAAGNLISEEEFYV